MLSPLLSIVIPTREEERAIGAAIKRLLVLKIPHEVIVSDGRSADQTVEIARTLADAVVVYDGTATHTAGRGRNDGARVAKGEFIAFLDADASVIDPNDFFARALAHFDDPRVMGVTGPQRARPDVETWADRCSYGISNFNMHAMNALGVGTACGKFMLVRRSVFEEMRGFREELVAYEDGDLFYRLSKRGRTVFDTRLVVYHGARRPHKIGWTRMWWTWSANFLSYTFFNKSISPDWTPVR